MKAFKIIVPIYIICFLIVASLGAVIISKAYAAKEIKVYNSITLKHNPPLYPPECKTLIFDYYTDATYKTIVENAEETTVISDDGLNAGGVSMFYESSNTTAYVLKKTDIEAPIDCYFLFGYLDSLTTIELRNFNTSNTTNMSYMFYRCHNLETIEFSAKFDCQNVTTMNQMFYSCSSLTTIKCAGVDDNVINFKTSDKLTSLNWMFISCGALQTLKFSENFVTSNVKNMERMFSGCSLLGSLDVSKFNTSSATNMERMFANCGDLTELDLSSFDTSNVTDMTYMFYNCNELQTIYVGDGWSTSSVSSSLDMFDDCNNLEGKQGTRYADIQSSALKYAKVDGGTSDPGYLTHINDKQTTT